MRFSGSVYLQLMISILIDLPTEMTELFLSGMTALSKVQDESRGVVGIWMSLSENGITDLCFIVPLNASPKMCFLQ